MSRSSSIALERLAAPDPEPLYKGLDAANLSLRRKWGKGKLSAAEAMEVAEAALGYEAELESATDARLRLKLDHLRRSLRREGMDSGGCRSAETLALLREIGRRSWGLRAHDNQLAGVLAMSEGVVIEMATGEGKTLAAALTALLSACGGKPCHVVTVNDYLAKRDAQSFGKLSTWTGVSVAAVTGEMNPSERKRAYAADVVYTTSKELLADFLRDRIALGTASSAERLALRQLAGSDRAERRVVQRGLHTAIVDEVDSVLIDEAVTPLIISRAQENDTLKAACEEAFRLSEELILDVDFKVDAQVKRVDLTRQGEDRLQSMAESLPPIWRGGDRRRELVEQALQAKHFFQREKQYIVEDGKIVIVDEFSGRLMGQRTWREGLHQAIEAREGLEITSPSETVARMSFQRFFRLFPCLSGMSGTAMEAAGELWQIYRLGVISIPTHRPIARQQYAEKRFIFEAEKRLAIVEEVIEIHDSGRPILLGTRSIEGSETLCDELRKCGLPVRLLNARKHEEEAQIIALAGKKGAITIATNMAGRGTDIRLGKGVAAMGGLHVIASERHESGRIDRQLFGRSGRQGDDGSARSFVSLEDELFHRFLPRFVSSGLKSVAGFLPFSRDFLFGKAASWAQWNAQNQAYKQRRRVLQSDQWLEESLGFAGAKRI
ncbi:MAG: DEAD/DEAH box helicase [Verrucomicrobiota bacterium]